MKKVMILLATAALCSCAGNGTKLTINGSVEGDNNGKEVVLMSNGTAVDTAIIENGKFTFEVDAANQSLMQVKQSRMVTPFVAAPGEVTVTLGETASATGNALTDELTAFQAANAKLAESFKAKQAEVAKQYGDDKEAISKAIGEYYSAEYVPARKELLTATFKKNETNAIGAYLFLDAVEDIDIAKIDAFIAANPNAANFERITKERSVLVNRSNTDVGKMFTDIVGSKMDKSGVAKLSDFVGKGNYVLVDFWASWCGPCKREIVYIKDVYNRFHKKGFNVVGVNVWDKYDPAVKCIKEEGMTWDMIYASDDKVATDNYGVKGIPTLVLFAPDGTIVNRTLRGEKMVEIIEELYK